jgi:tRNA threonylcarbamoyladenosine biosynthesis protein TsaB
MPDEIFLGIETSGEYTALALVRGTQVLASVNELTQAKHNERVFDLLDRMFAEAGLELTRLDGIGVTIGPGMFTSLRVGLSVAKGLAMTCGIALKGVNTLDAMAHTALARGDCPGFVPRNQGLSPATPGTAPEFPAPGNSRGQSLPSLLPLVDAHKGEVYCAVYEGCTRRTDYLLLAPDELPALVPGPVTLCTAATLPYRSALENGFGPRAKFLTMNHPAPETIAALAQQEINAGRADDVATLSPLYLRRTDAELRRGTAVSAEP